MTAISGSTVRIVGSTADSAMKIMLNSSSAILSGMLEGALPICQ